MFAIAHIAWHPRLGPALFVRHGSSTSDHSLLGKLDFHELLASGHHVLVLDTHDTTAPLSGQVGVIVELGLEECAELLEINKVFASHFSQSEASGRLEVDKLAKVGLATDEAEGDTLFAAESGQVNDHLDRVDVVSDHNHLCLVVLDQ